MIYTCVYFPAISHKAGEEIAEGAAHNSNNENNWIGNTQVDEQRNDQED